MTHSPTTPNLPETMDGYDAPLVWQFSVFLENRVGRMLAMLECFSGEPIRIASLTVLDASDHAVIRLVTSDADRTRRVLKQNRLPFSETEILVLDLEDVAIDKVCIAVLSAEISIHYMYPLMIRPYGHAVVALNTDNQYMAGDVLRRHRFRVLGEHELTDEPGEDPDGGDNPFDRH